MPRIRQAEQGDVDAILNLLTHYDLPRKHFEPLYQADPTYRPEHSWIAEEHGTVVAHLRIFERRMRLLGGVVRMGGIGNVVTAREARGGGIARLLLERVAAHLDATGHALSLLWTHAQRLYAAHGWQPIAQVQQVVALRADDVAPVLRIRRATDDDLPAVAALHAGADVERSGTMLRSRAEWSAQRAWLQEDEQRFLVTHDHEGQLGGYIRMRSRQRGLETLEIGAASGEADIARALLLRAAQPEMRVRVTLPPSLRSAIRDDEIVETPASQLMVRVGSLDALLDAVGPALRARAGDAGGTVSLTTAREPLQVRVTRDGVTAAPAPPEAEPLDAPSSAALIMYGAGGDNGPDVTTHPDSEALCRLFPQQDTVVWASDRF